MLIALEGHSYSGKTTLLNYLKDKKNKNIIAEHDSYAGGIENYPPFPPTTFQMAKNNVDFFANLEVKRAQDAQSYGEGDIFFDRSFLSVILFQKFMRFLNVAGQFEAYDYAKELFKNLLREEEIAFPNLLVFMSCESAENYAKRQSREISVGLLRGKEALGFFTQEYEKLCRAFENHGRLIRLISRDGEESLHENSQVLLRLKDNPARKRQTLIEDVMETI